MHGGETTGVDANEAADLIRQVGLGLPHGMRRMHDGNTPERARKGACSYSLAVYIGWLFHCI